jgi:hypothetical protein
MSQAMKGEKTNLPAVAVLWAARMSVALQDLPRFRLPLVFVGSSAHDGSLPDARSPVALLPRYSISSLTPTPVAPFGV